jgi:hypothetical protein
MMKERKQLLILITLFIVSCRAPHSPPDFTLCTYLDSGKIYCSNNAIPDLQNGKELDIKPSDIVMPPDSFHTFYRWGSDLRNKLIQCENQH